MSCSRSSMLVFVRVYCAYISVLRWHFGTKDVSGNFLSRYVLRQIYGGLWVGGEPAKTAGPMLRGAARSRTLQEGPNVCCGWAVSPGKPLTLAQLNKDFEKAEGGEEFGYFGHVTGCQQKLFVEEFKELTGPRPCSSRRRVELRGRQIHSRR